MLALYNIKLQKYKLKTDIFYTQMRKIHFLIDFCGKCAIIYP